MQATNRNFRAIIQGNNQFVIPVFQRDYSWTTEQCRQMWTDIMRTSGEEDDEHFLGSFVYVGGGGGAALSKWLVIDGQQRLTTLMLLLIALRNHIRETQWTGAGLTPDRIDDEFLTNRWETRDGYYKLSLRRHDNKTLRALVDRRDLSEVNTESELIVEAYRHFREQLKSASASPDKVYRGINRLSIVDVILDRRIDNPQRVFESLNSTGVDLTEGDLIRNYLLMGLPEDKQTRLYNKYWSELETLFRESGSTSDLFLRDYIALKTRATTPARTDRIYTEFKTFWTPSSEDTIETLLEDIVRFARYYVSFLRPDRIDPDSLVNAMRQVRQLGSAHALLIMRLYECYESNSLLLNEFIRSLNLIASYLVRRAVLGLETRNYWSVFARIAHAIREESSFESFRMALARQNYIFPSDERFVQGIQERNLYRLRICDHILKQLENAGQLELSQTSEYSIEHIMPQNIDNVQEWQEMLGDDWKNIHDSWSHRLGNLTLTAYNRSLSNRPFSEKQTTPGGFNQSAVRLNEYVRSQQQWSVSEMKERGCILAKHALKIWPHHEVDEDLLRQEDVQDLRKRALKRNASSLRMRNSVQTLLYGIRESIRTLVDPIEVIEHKSICYYNDSARFFAETLPMAWYVRLLLPIDFDEADDPDGVAVDATKYKFLPNVIHRNCGTFVNIREAEEIATVIPMIRQALNMSEE